MRHYHGLDLLRFFAAMLVVFYHLASTNGVTLGWPVAPDHAPLSWVSPVGQFGWVGVQIFFVLSGFIISASARNSDVWTFAKKRAIRVFPALWLAIPLAFVLRAAWGEPLGELAMAAFRSAVLSPIGPYIDGVVWTLVVEAIFYALIACVLLVPARFGDFDKTLYRAALLLGSASAAFIFATAVLLDGGKGIGLFGWFGFTVLLLRHGAYFALGMLLYQAIEGHRSVSRLVAIAIFACACWTEMLIMSKAHGSGLWPLLVWTAAIAFSYCSVRYGALLTKAPGWSVTKPVGKLTYPLYLNHFIVAQAILPLWDKVFPNAYMLFAAMLATLLALATAIALGPEAALQAWAKKRWLKPRERHNVQEVSDPRVA